MAFAGQEHIFVDMIDESKTGTVFESLGVGSLSNLHGIR